MNLGVALLRVSTDKQFQYGDSIDTQKIRVDSNADRDGTTIVRYFVEHYSGRKTDRAVIEELLSFLDEHTGEIKYIYIVEINRFTRGGGEIYLYLKRQLHKRGVILRDVMGVIQESVNTLEHLGFEYPWSVVSPSRTAEVMQAEYANVEVGQILTRTIGQQIKLAKSGYQARSADFGFQNIKVTTPDGKKPKIMEPLEPEAEWVRTVFKLRAEGTMTDEAICHHVNNMGYKSRRINKHSKETGKVIATSGEKLLEPKQLHRIITRPIYCGIRVGKWTHGKPLRAPFNGLVSIDMFNRANRGAIIITEHPNKELTIEYAESRKKHSHSYLPEFLPRHVVMCPECSNPLFASKSRGKSGKYFSYYHCDRSHKRFSVSQPEFEITVGSYLDNLQSKPGFLGIFKETVREIWISKNKEREGQAELIKQHVQSLQLKQENILDRIPLCTSAIVQSKLETEIENLDRAIKDAESQLQKTDLKEHQIEEYFRIAKNRLEHPREYALNAISKGEIEKVWTTIFTSPPTYKDIEFGTPDLTLIYRLNRGFNGDKEQLAGQLSVAWNTFTDEVIAFLK